MGNEIEEKFGGRLRVRVCGILIEQERILLIKHRGLGSAGQLWLPPGGGMQFGSSVTDNLKREFQEETGLQVAVHELLFVYEFHHNPLQAVELFFKVGRTGGTLSKGIDPELDKEKQIIEEVRFMGSEELTGMNPQYLHSVLTKIKNPSEILKFEGYFQNWK